MSDKSNRDRARDEGSESPDTISGDESVLGFLWGAETEAAQADAANAAGGDADDGKDLAGALARYGTWLRSLDGAS